MTSRTATQVVTKTELNLKTPPVFTLKDVAVHSTPTDCWVIVHGRVYDVSEFVPRHPGGSMIHVKAGGDCSHLFDSYHPLRAKCAPPSFEPCRVLDTVTSCATFALPNAI
jgi:cytochrome b involved in lipid metabolism